MWMSHVTHLFPSMAASSCRCSSSLTPPWLISSSHVTHVNESWHAYEWVISHICTNQVCVAAARIEHLRRIYEGFVSHMWMSHVTHTNESCHKYVPIECASLRLEFSTFVAYMKESGHTFLREFHEREGGQNQFYVTSYTWMEHVAQMKESNGSCRIYEGVMSYGVVTVSRIDTIIGLFCGI